MATPIVPLAEGFTPATRAEWTALVAKTMKGAGLETLTGRTVDDLPILPLYTADDGAAPVFAGVRRRGKPGWDIRAPVASADPAAANGEALEALAGGAQSLLVRIGADGLRGVRAAGEPDLARVLDGVMTDVAAVALDAGFSGPSAARWLGAVAKASPAAPLAFHMDPLSALAESGGSPGAIEAHVNGAAGLAAELAETYPRASLFLASGAVVHEAGGSPAWELGFAAAAAVAYAKALAAAGLPMQTAFAGVTLGLSVGAEPLAAIAKLRAARVLWRRIVQACGVEQPARIEARSSRRMLTCADRWTNLIRLTSAGFAAAVGGADAVVLGAFTDAAGPADAFASRLSRNTQLILMEEAHLGRVADPAGGSWAMEAQTAELARAAWAAFTAIEAAGGLATALQAGVVGDAVERSRARLAGALADRSLRVIGVTDFKSEEAAPESRAEGLAGPPLDDRRPGGADSTCPPLAPLRLEAMVTQ